MVRECAICVISETIGVKNVFASLNWQLKSLAENTHSCHFAYVLVWTQVKKIVLIVPKGTCASNAVQVPCRGRNFTFFTLVDHPAVNEKWLSVYFIPSERYEEVRQTSLIS